MVSVVQHCLLKEAELVDRQEQLSVCVVRGREREKEETRERVGGREGWRVGGKLGREGKWLK